MFSYSEPSDVWLAKLAAWTHDPAEKALVLLRDPVGHTGGTVAELRETIFASAGPTPDIERVVKSADQWASAADRPQFPRSIRVRFDEQPILIHPLDGQKYDLHRLDIDVASIRAVSFDHFRDLIIRDDRGAINFKCTFLNFWRHGPARPAPELGALWQVLPADTRVPTHSIWEHLNLTSALAGAMKADPKQNVALLKISIGPVQSFIEQSRTTSDLWAGSHLLSRTMWEGLKVLCDEIGPDCVLFPDLHGLPFVDAWLRECGIKVISSDLERATDENPLFVAALVNVAVAVVPDSAASELARKMTEKMRHWILERAKAAAQKIHAEAGLSLEGHSLVVKQMEEQLREFPETYWAAVPWRLAVNGSELDVEPLRKILQRFYPQGKEAPGFLASPAWTVLSNQVLTKEAEFYRPNPGVIYPALHDLLDRSFGAAKSARLFEPIEQSGYRCTLCGEREWLAADRNQLQRPRGKREETVWQALAQKRPSWVRPNEYLCAVCTLKRLWPTLFLNEVTEYIKDMPSRFVVSTHTMALAPTLQKIVEAAENGLNGFTDDQREAFRELLEEIDEVCAVALPAQLYGKARKLHDQDLLRLVRGLPALLDQVAEEEEEYNDSAQPGTQVGQPQAAALKSRKCIEERIEKLAGVKPERYYALILMDGDRMGAWVSGTADELLLPYEKTWHPSVLAHESLSRDELKAYRQTLHQSSPSRHVAISRALNAFATHLVRLVVEELHMGKLLYAGGDDLLAMVSIDDLLDVMWWLRCAFSGSRLDEQDGRLRLRGGHAVLSMKDGQKRLLRLMGGRATASMGAVVAHYSAPLQAVLRELRQAEKRAKQVPGKDAFSVTLMKRAGGLAHFTAKWRCPVPGERSDGSQSSVPPASNSVPPTIAVLKDLRDTFGKLLSRQAAYQTLEWLSRLGEGADASMAQSLILREFRRHMKDDQMARWDDVKHAAVMLVQAASAMHEVGAIPQANQLAFIKDAINLAEFLAREGRLQ
jgi:CRISPR-associated protein Cmr2